jgi:hypothetical protein
MAAGHGLRLHDERCVVSEDGGLAGLQAGVEDE